MYEFLVENFFWTIKNLMLSLFPKFFSVLRVISKMLIVQVRDSNFYSKMVSQPEPLSPKLKYDNVFGILVQVLDGSRHAVCKIFWEEQ